MISNHIFHGEMLSFPDIPMAKMFDGLTPDKR